MNETPVKILLIEDDADDTDLLRESFADVSTVPFFRVTSVERLAEAVQRLRAEDFDIVLLDLFLPDSQGLETFVTLHDQVPDVPIVILTGFDDEAMAIQAVQSGAQDYLSKGRLESCILLRILRHAIERHRLLHEVGQQLRALQASEARCRDMIDKNVDSMIIVDEQKIVRFVNAATADLFCRPAAEFLGTVFDFPILVGEAQEVEIIANGDRVTAEMRVVETNWEGRMAFLASLRDISNRKRAGEALREAKEYTEQILYKVHQDTARLLSAIPSLLIGLDAHRRIIWWNTMAQRTLGIAPATVIGELLEACDIPWDHPKILAALAHCHKTGQPMRLDDVHFRCPDGKEGLLGFTINYMQGSAGEELCFLLIGADITERRVLQAQLIQAQKLESIGRLTAGIAHEINTPTQYVGDNTRFLHEAFGDLDTLLTHYTALLQAAKSGTVPTPLIQEVEATAEAIDVDYLREEIPTAIRQSLEGVTRVATIIRAMKEFSHPGSGEKTAIDLNKAIESTITVARNEWKYVADMGMDFDPALPPVLCLPGEFNQVVLNMIVNAAHSIAKAVQDRSETKGTITVSTRQDGDWVEVRIADTGTGIPKASRDKIFDPFFTTKEVGKGTGQGLAIAYDVVVKKHEGKVTFETTEGEGTTFIIRLPLKTPGAQGKGEKYAEEEAHSRG